MFPGVLPSTCPSQLITPTIPPSTKHPYAATPHQSRPILDLLHTTAVGSRVGPRAVPPEPGDDEAEGLGSKWEEEDEELGEESRGRKLLSFPWVEC